MTIRFAAVFALFCVFMVAGCEDGGVKTVPVTGRITYGGGDWPKGGTITFAPLEAAQGMTSHPGSANFGPDGKFAASTFADGDGLVPGKYSVNIECWEVPPSMETPGSAKSYVPDEFQSGARSGFTVEVPADASGPIEANFDVPKP